jgi:hypothetical protein
MQSMYLHLMQSSVTTYVMSRSRYFNAST